MFINCTGKQQKILNFLAAHPRLMQTGDHAFSQRDRLLFNLYQPLISLYCCSNQLFRFTQLIYVKFLFYKNLMPQHKHEYRPYFTAVIAFSLTMSV